MKTFFTFLFLVVALVPVTATGNKGFTRQDWKPMNDDINQAMKTGYYNLTEFNFGLGLNKVDVPYSERYAGVTNISGYRFMGRLEAGVGTGVLFYNEGTTLPLFLDVRYYLGQKRVKPFAAATGGLKFRIAGADAPTNYFANPAAGLTLPLGFRSSLSFSVGILSMTHPDDNRDSFFSFKAGLLMW